MMISQVCQPSEYRSFIGENGATGFHVLLNVGNQHVGCLVINHLDVTKFLVCIIEMKIHC